MTDSSQEISNIANGCSALIKALAKNCISVVVLDLGTGKTVVLKGREAAGIVGKEFLWDDLLERYFLCKTHPEDRDRIHSLKQDCLCSFLEQGREEFEIEVRCIFEKDLPVWVKFDVSIISVEEKRLLITTRNVDEDRMMKSIVDKYVYEELDYFVLIHSKINYYTMYSGKKSGTPLPPMSGDYAEAVYAYNRTYVVPEDCEWVSANMQVPHVLKMLEKEDNYSFLTRCITDEGEHRWIRVQFLYYDKSAGLILVTRTDITQIFLEEQEKNERLAAALRDAKYDALTAVLNRGGIETAVVDSLQQQSGGQAAVLFIDVDNFKMVNDTLGHAEGDRLLKFLAKSIEKIAGETGFVGRIGGDEFLLFLPGVSSIGQINRCAEGVCHISNSSVKELEGNIPVSCSVGISRYPEDGIDYETLLRKADQALYISKRYGKNRYCFYSEELTFKG